MAEDAVSFITSEDEAEVREDRTQAPELFALDSGQLPFERMGDAHFELLVADVFRAELQADSEDWYDTVSRLNDGADQGRDVILFNEGSPVGVIQCKRLKKTLELDALIYEICKFFLYAHIRPQISSTPGTAFRYYVAVADGVSAKLFEFMQGTGQARFDDLRATFQTKCGTVRTKSETLKKHPFLKNLTKPQLCNIVWQWIPHLQTRVLKKDSLSSLVAKHSIVKRTYFQLESDSTAIIESIRDYLVSQGGALSGADEPYLKKIRTEYIDRELREGDQLNIGLIQGKDLIPFLQAMLAPEVGMFEQSFGNRPVVLAAGSAGAAPGQWSDINALVEAYPNPLVLVVGCGEVTGAMLIGWTATDGMSSIDPSWKPAPAQKFRAGWCWVTDPAEGLINCYVLVENEPNNPDFDRGNISLRLAFKDLIVWPTLGNDFTNSLQNKNSQLRRIIASQADDRQRRHNLILTSQHITDLKGIAKSLPDYYARRLTSSVVVAAANSGQLRNCSMKIHSATGIFPAADRAQSTRSSLPGIQPPSRVMRRSTSGGMMLTLTWDANGSLERVKGLRLQGGVVQDDLEPAALEFHELFDRHPPDAYYLDLVKEEFQRLNTLVQAGSIKDSQGFTYQTRYGVKPDNDFTLEEMASSGKYVMRAVKALSYLKSHKDSVWITEPGTKGHLQFSNAEGEYNVLAWANDDFGVRDMANDLYRWARGTANHPLLVVFANGIGRVEDTKPGESTDDEETSRERFDISDPPHRKDSITDIAMVNKVYFFALDGIESMYDKAKAIPAEDFMDDISTRRKTLDAQ
ncbi:ATPase [Pseudomonas sp. Bout1]|uniref:ABC-three component system protein n=1 Tax=Pseudomonas sp. Bout1 TaxID=3048600 RepID=UPI002AB4AB5B|nr:ABC-three component system protein [Pseudomonas sp. Bout1]MDY7532246.1 ATPase [Pseudomonas sp. Bout1]MEB0184207.1 ATPase [Pseudomonas sp. Bout1]